MTFKIQVAQGLKWQAISILGRQVLSLAVFTTLARVLEPSAFGLVALVGVYLGVVMMFVDQGLTQALIQRQNLMQEHKDAAFWFNLACALILCFVTIALAEPIAKFFKEPQLAPLLRWSSFGLVIGASSSIHATLFTKAMDFRQPVIRGLIANAVGGAVGVGMALKGCGVWSLVGQQLAGEISGAIFLWSMSTYRPALKFSVSHFRDLFGVSSSVFVTSVLWYFSSRLDQLVIGRFAGSSPLGIYTIAAKIPSLASMVTQQPLAIISLPSLSRLQADYAKMREAVYKGMELNAVVSFAVFVGLAAVTSELVPLLFGAKWAEAALLCSLLSLSALIETLLIFLYPILLASGGIGKYVWLNIWHTVGVMVACLVGIHFGIAFLVVGLIMNNLIVAIPALLFARHRIGLSPMGYCKPCLVPGMASLFMVLIIWLTQICLPKLTLPAGILACKITVGAMSYCGFMLIFKRAAIINLFDLVGHALGVSSKKSTITVSLHADNTAL